MKHTLFLLLFIPLAVFSQDLPCRCYEINYRERDQKEYKSYDENKNLITHIVWVNLDTSLYEKFSYDKENRVISSIHYSYQKDNHSNKRFEYEYLKNYKTIEKKYENDKLVSTEKYTDYYYLERDRVNHFDAKGNEVKYIFKDSLLIKIEKIDSLGRLIEYTDFIYDDTKLKREITKRTGEKTNFLEIEYDYYGNKSLTIERLFGDHFSVSTDFFYYNDNGPVERIGYIYEDSYYGFYHYDFKKVLCYEIEEKNRTLCNQFMEAVKEQIIGKWEVSETLAVSEMLNLPNEALLADSTDYLKRESIYKVKTIEFKKNNICLLDGVQNTYEILPDSACNPLNSRFHPSYSCYVKIGETKYIIGSSDNLFINSGSNINGQMNGEKKNSMVLRSNYTIRSYSRFLKRLK